MGFRRGGVGDTNERRASTQWLVVGSWGNFLASSLGLNRPRSQLADPDDPDSQLLLRLASFLLGRSWSTIPPSIREYCSRCQGLDIPSSFCYPPADPFMIHQTIVVLGFSRT